MHKNLKMCSLNSAMEHFPNLSRLLVAGQVTLWMENRPKTNVIISARAKGAATEISLKN